MFTSNSSWYLNKLLCSGIPLHGVNVVFSKRPQPWISPSSRQGKAKNFTPKKLEWSPGNQIAEGIKYDVSSQPFYIIVIGWLVLHVGYLSLKSLDTGMSCRYWM